MRHDPRAVRISADGMISLHPFVDFREPGRRLPPPPKMPDVPIRRLRGDPPLPEWLRLKK